MLSAKHKNSLLEKRKQFGILDDATPKSKNASEKSASFVVKENWLSI